MNKRFNLTDAEIFEMCNLYLNQNFSARQIGTKYNLHHNRVVEILRSCGISTRSKEEQNKFTWKLRKHHNIGLKGKDAYWVYGRKKTEEEKKHLSEINMGDKNRAWKGGRRVHSGGYVLVYMPEHPCAEMGCVLEHRFVAEQLVGRPLKTEECVHHKNGIKTDNRIENLEITNMADHARYHMNLRISGGNLHE